MNSQTKIPFTLENAGELVQGLNNLKKPRNWAAIYKDLKTAARVKATATIRIPAKIKKKGPVLNAVFRRFYLGAELVYKFEDFERVAK